jgi:hypothetical protein
LLRKLENSTLMASQKVRYRRYALPLVTAAYDQYASFLGIRKP